MTAAWTLALDPPAVIEGRTELQLNSGAIALDGKQGIDWGEAAIKAFLAEQRYGEVPADYRIPNRIITIPLVLGAQSGHTLAEEESKEETARRQLEEKIGLLQRQGGVLLRQRSSGEPLYADVVNANLIVPDIVGEGGGVEPGVVLKLECLPDFYGEEVTLEPLEGAGISGVLQAAKANAVIAGDYPARCRIVVLDKSGDNQRSLLWGFRSTFYSAATSEKLVYNASELTPLNGATVVASAETGNGKAIEINKPEKGSWYPFMSTDPIAGGQLQHLGSFRVFARVKAGSAALRLSWSIDDALTPTSNEGVVVGTSEEWWLVDLGEVRLPEAVAGSERWWRGFLEVNSSAGGAALADRIWLQPIDDGAGRLQATGVPTSTLIGPQEPPTTAASAAGEGTAWTNPEGAITTGASASVSLAAGTFSQQLALKKPGFAIPTVGVTIHGIEVIVPNWTAAAQGSGNYWTRSAQLYKAGALYGERKTVGLGSGPITFGSPNDLWGKAWTAAQINEAGFGVALLAEAAAGSHTVFHHVYGQVEIRVYYSFSATGLTQDAVLYANRSSEIRTEGAFREDTTTEAYVPVSSNIGDLPRLPPSGLEGRPVQLFIKNSRGLLAPAEADAGASDTLKATVSYRPCFIGRI